ncbi:hypothetical protein KA005_37745, partial [bacterium]|nr:hypothetical protein [bacterium]
MRETRINFIRAFGEDKTEGKTGENVGLVLDEHFSVEGGEFIVQKEHLPRPTKCFKGNIFWVSHQPLQINKTITLRCATQEVKCIAKRIEKRIDSSTLEVMEEDAKELRLNEAGEVIFKTEKPIVVERFNFIEEL